MRRWAASKMSSRARPTSTSETMKPGCSALVESDREVDPVGGQAGQAAQVGRAAVDRGQVHLEVAGVHDRARGGAQGDRHAVGDRVRHGVELEVERAQGGPLAGRHLDQRRVELVLLELGREHGQRQPGPVDGHVEVAQEVGQGAHVVLVGVGEDHPDDPFRLLGQPGEVGQDDVHAGLVGVGEGQPAVDQQPGPVQLDHGAVAPDLPQPAQERDPVGRPRRAPDGSVRGRARRS